YLFDGQRQVATDTITTATLTAAARQGIFRFFPGVQNGNANANVPTVDLSGNPIKPGSATGDLQSVSVFGRDPSRPSADTTGFIKALMALHPLPTDFTTGDGLNTAGIRWQRKSGANRNQHNLRLDENFNQSERLTINYTRERNYG